MVYQFIRGLYKKVVIKERLYIEGLELRSFIEGLDLRSFLLGRGCLLIFEKLV